MYQIVVWVFLFSPLLLFPAAARLHLSPLWVCAAYLLEWIAWEIYLRTMHPELWVRADLFLIIPAQIGALAYALRRRKELRSKPPA